MRKWIVWVPVLVLLIVLGGAIFARAHAAGMMGVGRLMKPATSGSVTPPPVTPGAFDPNSFDQNAFDPSAFQFIGP